VFWTSLGPSSGGTTKCRINTVVPSYCGPRGLKHVEVINKIDEIH